MKIEVEAPDNINPKDAQQCFLLGLKALSQCNNAGICILQGVERDNDTAIMMLSFKGEYAAAISKFCQGVRYLSSRDTEKNLAIMRDQGSEILKGLENGKK